MYADGPFEIFLIDGEMGPQTSTLRIKQAISGVQLNMQQFFLGIKADIAKAMFLRETVDLDATVLSCEVYRKLFCSSKAGSRRW